MYGYNWPYDLWITFSTKISFSEAFFVTYGSIVMLILLTQFAMRCILLLVECGVVQNCSKRNRCLSSVLYFLLLFNGFLITMSCVGIILVFILFSKIPPWLGTLLITSTLILSWLHSNRTTIVVSKAEKRRQQEQDFKAKLDKMFQVKLLDPELSTYYEESETKQTNSLYKKFSSSLKNYNENVYSGVRKRAALFIFGIIVILILSPCISYLSCDICIESHPHRTSTFLTRILERKDKRHTCGL